MKCFNTQYWTYSYIVHLVKMDDFFVSKFHLSFVQLPQCFCCFFKSLHAGKRWFLSLIRKNIMAYFYVRTYDKWNFKSKKSSIFHFQLVNDGWFLFYLNCDVFTGKSKTVLHHHNSWNHEWTYISEPWNLESPLEFIFSWIVMFLLENLNEIMSELIQ